MNWAMRKAIGGEIAMKQARNACCRLLHKSKDIMGIGEDLKVLRQGLSLLTKLKKVSVIGGPSMDPGSAWYFKHGAHAQDFAGTPMGATLWSCQLLEDPPRYHDFDARAFCNLLRALQEHDTTHGRMTEMHVGNWSLAPGKDPLKMGLPLTSLYVPECGHHQAPRNPGHTRRIARNLQAPRAASRISGSELRWLRFRFTLYLG